MKNLQTEYVKDIENDVPDLWNRIEKGLDEIEKPAVTPKKVVPFYSTKAFKIACESVGIAACLLILISVFASNADYTKKEAAQDVSYCASVESNGATAYESAASPEDAQPYEEATAQSHNSTDASEAPASNVVVSSEASVEPRTDSVLSTETDSKEWFLIPNHLDEVEELDDGTYKLGDYIYAYKYELTGAMGANNDGFCTVLSNREDITFSDCLAASPLGSDTRLYFDPQDSVIVSFEIKKDTR